MKEQIAPVPVKHYTTNVPREGGCQAIYTIYTTTSLRKEAK
jgi:hypothetical protein